MCSTADYSFAKAGNMCGGGAARKAGGRCYTAWLPFQRRRRSSSLPKAHVVWYEKFSARFTFGWMRTCGTRTVFTKANRAKN